MRKYKILLFLPFIIFSVVNFIGCAGKQPKEVERKITTPKEHEIEKAVYRDVISYSMVFGSLNKKVNTYLYEFSLKDKYKGKGKEFLMNTYSFYCRQNLGEFNFENSSVRGDYTNIILNGLLKENIPEVYINDYIEHHGGFKISPSKMAKYLGVQSNYDLFCYLPSKKKFFYLIVKKDKFYIYKNDMTSALPLVAKWELRGILFELKKKINKDLEKIVWISLNLPLYYRGVKLFYFKAEPLNRRDLVHNEFWNAYFKFKNETTKAYILNIANITLVKEGREYKPLFHIDRHGNILDYKLSGDCKNLGNNKIAVEPGGICEIYFIKERQAGGLRFIGVKDIKGSILVFDKYPIYIWSMTRYDMKVKNLAEGVR